MNVIHDKPLRRFVWFIGLAFLIAGFATPVTGISSFLISIMFVFEFVAVYSLERRFIGVIGHIGFIVSSLVVLMLNWKSYVAHLSLNVHQIAVFVWLLFACFTISCTALGISTIKSGFLPTETGYLLLVTPAILLLPSSIERFALAAYFLAVGFFLMMFVSRRGEYDAKVAAQQSVHRTAGSLRVF
jgi:hypothetical protein